ncbi:MAG: hypothetical protein J2P21_13620, partial [Chloracidobacterium sp.]|nr:hypothetical protein [Chloracidobacterium sp.]
MAGFGDTKSDNNGIAIVTSSPGNPESAIHNPQSDNPEIPQSPIPNPRSQSPAHFSILQYAQNDEQNVKVKPLPRAFNPQPLNYDHRILLLAFFTGLPGAIVALVLLWKGYIWKGEFDTKTQWTLTVFIVICWLG